MQVTTLLAFAPLAPIAIGLVVTFLAATLNKGQM
jgi:hypothetical protein